MTRTFVRPFAQFAAIGVLATALPMRAAAQSPETMNDALRRISAALAKPAQGKTVAVFELVDMQDRTNDLTRLVTEKLTTEMVKASIGSETRIVERRQVTQVLTELNMIRGGLTTSEISAAAKQLGANAVVIGSLQAVGSTIELNARVLAVPDATILAAESGTVRADQDLLGMETSGSMELPKPGGGLAGAKPDPVVRGNSSETSFLRLTVENAVVSTDGTRAVVTVSAQNKLHDQIGIAMKAGGAFLNDSQGSAWRLDRGSLPVISPGDWTFSDRPQPMPVGPGEKQILTFEFYSSSPANPSTISLNLGMLWTRGTSSNQSSFSIGIPNIPVKKRNE